MQFNHYGQGISCGFFNCGKKQEDGGVDMEEHEQLLMPAVAIYLALWNIFPLNIFTENNLLSLRFYGFTGPEILDFFFVCSKCINAGP